MKQKTETWLRLAEEDLAFARDLVKRGERFHYAVHFCHQAIENMAGVYLVAYELSRMGYVALPTNRNLNFVVGFSERYLISQRVMTESLRRKIRSY